MLGQIQLPGSQSPLDAEREKLAAQPVDDSELYWAARSPEAVIAELNKKESAFYTAARQLGFIDMTRVMIRQYFGQGEDGEGWVTQVVGFDGFQDEYVRFRLNETRSYMDQGITMAIGQRPAFECSATNSDYDSIGQAESADNVITYVYEDKYGEKRERSTVTKGELGGLSFAWVSWDPSAGETVTEPVMVPQADGKPVQVIDPMTGKGVTQQSKAGDLFLRSIGWWDQFSEITGDEPEDHLWRVVRERRPKQEVAGKFKDKRKEILALGGLDDWTFERLFRAVRSNSGTEGDEVIVKHFYHPPCAAFAGTKWEKKGRYLLYVGAVPLLDTDLPYPRIPLIDYCPKPFLGTVFGYAVNWDLCAINQMEDQVVSDIASNLSTFGRQIVSVEEGTDFSADDIANGLKVLTRRPGTKAPEGLQLAQIPNASEWFLGFLDKKFQSISALNSVARGDPEANISSGQMAALFHSIALEAQSDRQQAVDSMRERLANLILDVLKEYAKHPFIVRIAGADERPYLDTFTRDKLLGVRGVTIKTSNPMMRTQAGRMQLAEYALKMGAVHDPGQLNEIFVSGQVKPLYDSERKRRMRIKLEDEMLLELGQKWAQDQPQLQQQIQSNPELAANPQAVQAITEQVSPIKHEVPPPPPLPQPGMPPPPPPELPYDHLPAVPVHWMDNHEAHINQHAALLASREALQNKAIWDVINVHMQHHKKVWQESDPASLLVSGNKPYPMPPPPAPPPGMQQQPVQAVMPNQHPANTNAQVPPGMQRNMSNGTDGAGVRLPEPSKSPITNNTPQGPG